MGKPDSIKKFDYLYLGSIVVGLLGLVLGWGTLMEQMNAEMAKSGLDPESGAAYGAIIGGVIFGTLISLALWFLISVLRIEFVKWILILFAMWGVFSILTGTAAGMVGMVEIAGIVSTIMSLAAIWMLFKPDAKEWFAAKRGD